GAAPGHGHAGAGRVRWHAERGRASRMVLGVGRAGPGSLDGRVDEVDPVGVLAIAGRRKGQHLPLLVVADDREHRLTAWPSSMAKGSWVARVRSHQPLLHGEDQLVRGVESLRWERRVAPAKADLECADGLAQPGWRLYEVEQAKRFDVIEQDVGFRKENPSL